MSIVTGLIIAGPTVSIMHNLQEVHRTAQCVGDIVRNHSEEMQSAYSHAYKDMSTTIQESLSVWVGLSGKIENALEPARKAIDTAVATIENFGKDADRIRGECENAVSGVSM